MDLPPNDSRTRTPALPLPAFLSSTILFGMLPRLAVHINGAYRAPVLARTLPAKSSE